MSGTAFRTGLPAGTTFGPWPWGAATVYVLMPPLLCDGGFQECVIVGADPKTHTVGVYTCDDSGFSECEPLADFPGSVDADHALRELGYEVVVLDGAA